MKKVFFTVVILMILVAGIVGASVAGYIWFKPSKTGTYTGPTGTTANLTENTGTTFTGDYQWIAYPVQLNSSSFWINATTTVAGPNLVVYLMNSSQFSNFQNNTGIAYLVYSGVVNGAPSVSYYSTMSGTYYVIWMSIVTTGITFGGSVAISAKT